MSGVAGGLKRVLSLANVDSLGFSAAAATIGVGVASNRTQPLGDSGRGGVSNVPRI